MKLINFIEKFDSIISEINTNLYVDGYIDYKTFINHNCEYDLEFSGKLEDIPIMYGNYHMVNEETYIDWDKRELNIYIRDRKGK